MRAILVAFVVLVIGLSNGISQPPDAKFSKKPLPTAPGEVKVAKDKGPPAPFEPDKEILREIKEAYKAPLEVHDDVLAQLRKSYQRPSADREAKIFEELRRLYAMTPAQEASILQEIRRAYQQPSVEQEARIFQEIAKADRLPVGAVPPSVQLDQASKMFRKLDRNGDGLLSPDEMPASLQAELTRWDTNRDGVIDANEYWSFYQDRLRTISERVASGQTDPATGKPVAAPNIDTPAPPTEEEPRAIVYRGAKLPPDLPAWFAQLDTNHDGQISLYEWKASGRPIEEFFSLDLNNDGLITVEEVQRYQAQQARKRPGERGHSSTVSATAKP